jgi:hemoglobin
MPLKFSELKAVEQRTTMNPDIQTRADLDRLTHRFFEQLLDQATFSQFFFEVANVKLGEHLKRFTDFWESALFKTGGYNSDMMVFHMDLDNMMRIEKDHFEQWLSTFNATVDDLFEGEKANEIKEKARAIAIVLEMKINLRNQQRIKFGN